MEAIETYITVKIWADYLIPVAIVVTAVAVLFVGIAVSLIRARIEEKKFYAEKKKERLEALNSKED